MNQLQLTSKGGAFRSLDGRMIVLSHLSSTGTDVFLSDDGVIFRQLFPISSNWDGGSDTQEIECRDPLDSKLHYTVIRDGCVVELFGGQPAKQPYGQCYDLGTIEYEPFPTARGVQHFYGLVDGRHFYASQMLFDSIWPVGGWRAYIGTGDAMERTEVTGAGYERTPRIETAAGILWLASDGSRPYWQEAGSEKHVNAMRADPRGYTITETDDGVVITPKVDART